MTCLLFDPYLKVLVLVSTLSDEVNLSDFIFSGEQREVDRRRERKEQLKAKKGFEREYIHPSIFISRIIEVHLHKYPY